jgi:hypothetical protein
MESFPAGSSVVVSEAEPVSVSAAVPSVFPFDVKVSVPAGAVVPDIAVTEAVKVTD